MELNPTIWGTDEEQTKVIGGYAIATYGIAGTTVTTADTLGNYKENHGTSEPIDESINYWQLWDKSPFNHSVFIRKDGANNHIYTEVKSIKPKSIFVTLRPTQVSDINFDINSQYTHLWEPEIAYPNSRIPYGNYGDIVTKFDYNKIGARFIPCVYHRDENGYPVNGSVPDEFESIYGYFHGEEDGVPVSEKYIITGLSVELFPLTGTGANGYNQNNVFYPVSSTPVETPQPNYYYQDSDYITYTRGQYIIGGLISSSGGYGYQIGAYGQSSHAPCWGYDPDNHWELKSFTNSSNQYIEYFEFTGTYEDLLSQCASLGFWFREDLQPGSTISSALFPMVTGENCDDDRVIMPIIENGQTTGRYLRGSEAAAHPQAQWGVNWRENAGYNGDKPYDGGGRPKPTPDSNPITPTTPGFSLAVENGSVSYVITQAEWKRIWNDIYGGTKSQWKSIIDGLALYGANPLNAILNYRWYPFALTGSQTDPMRLGSTIIKPATHVYHYIAAATEAFNSASASFWWGDDKNFINARKTKARLFLPFYGFYELPTSMLLEKELTIQFQYNLPDDTAVWFIEFGGSIYDYVECQPYIEIPITGDNSLQIAAAKAQRNLSIAMTVGAAVAGAGFGIAAAAPGLASIGAAASESAWAFGGSRLAAGLANIGPLMGENLLTVGQIGATAGAAGALAGGGIKAANTVMQSALQIGNLSTNVPVHSAGSDTTFLHMPMIPYIEFYVNNLQEDFDENGYKISTGIACDKWAMLSEMPEGSLLQTTGVGNMSTMGMELAEVQELNSILQSGFYL